MLEPSERRFLLALARRSVAAAAEGKPPPAPQEVAAQLGQELTPALAQPRGAFVTLTAGRALRGCIGYIDGVAPLARAVAENAAAAASRDPRFDPVAPSEVAGLKIEISALTPLRDVAGPGDIVVGRHGVVLSKGGARAVFLPQVAVEQGWDLTAMLDQLALKARLPAGAWRQRARFQVFEAEVFADEPRPV